MRLSAITCLTLVSILTGTALAEEKPILWESPDSGVFAISPQGGWSSGDPYDGPLIGIRGLFIFDHFVGAACGQAVFVDSGAIYVVGLDLHVRYGPFHGGPGFSSHFIPGGDTRPVPAMSIHAGIFIPTGLAGLFVDLAYRPNIVFHSSREEVYHTFLLGLLFETGS
jgi:hypothetical protein